MTETIDPHAVHVVDNSAEGRFEARLVDRLLGFSTYRLAGRRVVFLHTETSPELEGQGIGGLLVSGALDQVRARGLKVVPRCPFVAAHIRRHPEYADLVAT